MVFSWKAADERFANLRAEMWWTLSDWIREGASIPPNPALLSELCAPTYSNDNAANRLALESKDDIRKRIGVSPDLADALALTFAFPVVKAGEYGQSEVGRAITEYDATLPAGNFAWAIAEGRGEYPGCDSRGRWT